jgi:hypothetical protein
MANESRKEILYDHFNYVLWLDDAGNYDLEIIANNSAAYYTIGHRLTSEEADRFRKSGKRFIEGLANKYRSQQTTDSVIEQKRKSARGD